MGGAEGTGPPWKSEGDAGMEGIGGAKTEPGERQQEEEDPEMHVTEGRFVPYWEGGERGQREGERWVGVDCVALSDSQLWPEPKLAVQALVREGHEQAQRGRWWLGPVGGQAGGSVCLVGWRQGPEALPDGQPVGQRSQNHSRCPGEGWGCWARSCGCLDQCLWCHCCHRRWHCGCQSSLPPPHPPPLPLTVTLGSLVS